MRKVAVLAVLTIAAIALPATSQAAKKAAAPVDPAMAAQQNTSDFMRDAMNPYEATMVKPEAAKGKKKK
jgi:hypothetical protein